MTLQEWINQNRTVSGYVVACHTDHFLVDVWPTMAVLEEGKLLEIRIFNREMESRLFRTDISREFVSSKIEDGEGAEYMDEWQYLDIDTNKSAHSFNKEHVVFATGGGRYLLPLECMENAGVLVRSYFRREKETGRAVVCGYRLVEFGEVKNRG